MALETFWIASMSDSFKTLVVASATFGA